MKWLIVLLFVFNCAPGHAQQPLSGEDFVNAVAGLVVDSSFSRYYLFSGATPCSFKKFDYDEWYKYGLKEGVVCKGTQKSGAFRGHIWMAKIKTKEYFDKLYRMFDGNDKEIKKYWE